MFDFMKKLLGKTLTIQLGDREVELMERLLKVLERNNGSTEVLAALHTMEGHIMSAISDWAARTGPKLDRIQTGLDAVQALVEQLQNSPGTITPEDQALLDEIEAKVDAIATDADSVPAPPTTPA